MPSPKSSIDSAKSVRTQRSPETLLSLAMLALIAGAVWTVYGRAVDSPFIFDDTFSLTDNPSIVRLWPLVGNFEQPGPLYPSNDLPTSGRPLVNLSLALNYHFGQFDPVGYHVFNLIVHILSAMLLLMIVRRTLRLDYFGGRFDLVSGPLALAVALLWALHPLQTETVIYVTQRTELLVSFFYLATLYGSLRYWSAASPRSRTTWLALATLACLAGMACKEVMVSAPVVVLLFERTFITGSFRKALQKSWALYVGLALGWGLLLLLNYTAPRSSSAGFHLSVQASTWWLTQMKVFWMYLRLTVWPWPLAIHYEMPYLTTAAAAWPWLLLTTLLGIATLALLWRRSSIGFIGAWVLLILSPTIIVPIATEVAAERRMYLPLAALAALYVIGGYALIQIAVGKLRARSTSIRTKSTNWWPTAIVIAAALLLAAVFSLVSVRRLAAYHDPVTLWKDVLASQPKNSTAYYNIGKALKDSGHADQAIDYYQQALQLKPDNWEAHNNLGVAFARTGRKPEALAEFEQALHFNANDANTHNNYGNALKESNRVAEAIEQYQRALQLKPNLSEAHSNLGHALLTVDKPQEALEHFEKSVRLNPDFAEAQSNLAVALYLTGRTDEAITHYQRALQLNPNYTQAYANLALAYARDNRRAEAIAAAEKALELARSQGQTALAQQVESRLTAYRSQPVDRQDPSPQPTTNHKSP